MSAEAINPWIDQRFDASFRKGFENVTLYSPGWIDLKTGEYILCLSGSPEDLQEAFKESEIGKRFLAIADKLEALGGKYL